MNKDEANYHKLLGNRIKQSRKKAGLTQEDLAAFLDVQRTAITNKELGRQKVSAWEVVVICRVCGVLVGELLAIHYDDLRSEESFNQGSPFNALSSLSLCDRIELF